MQLTVQMFRFLFFTSVPTVWYDEFDSVIDGYNAAAVTEMDLWLPLRDFDYQVFKAPDREETKFDIVGDAGERRSSYL